MLIREFKVDPLPSRQAAFDGLATGRQVWRARQLAAAVRDNPVVAAEQLREMGFDVVPPEPAPELNLTQVRAL